MMFKCNKSTDTLTEGRIYNGCDPVNGYSAIRHDDGKTRITPINLFTEVELSMDLSIDN